MRPSGIDNSIHGLGNTFRQLDRSEDQPKRKGRLLGYVKDLCEVEDLREDATKIDEVKLYRTNARYVDDDLSFVSP